MFERPRQLRPPSAHTRSRRFARWAKARRSPFGRVLQAIGRADQRTLVYLRTRGHGPGTDRIVQGLGIFGELGAGWVVVAGSGAALRPERRRHWLAAAAAAPVAILVNYSVKLTVGRQRPLLDDHPPLARAPSKLSFPSAHSTSAVAAAVTIGRVSPSSRPWLYALAGAICLGRPYLGMHYPTDVLAGATLGYLVGRIFPLPPEPREAASKPPASSNGSVVVEDLRIAIQNGETR